MSVRQQNRRRRLRFVAIWATAGAAVMLTLSTMTLLSPANAAGTPAGAAQIVGTGPPPPGGHGGEPLNSGGSATEFTVKLPANASCPGDSANDGYKVQTYMVSDAINPATLQFGSQGPTGSSAGTHATFKQPLYASAGGAAIANEQTQDKTTTQPRGVILEFEAMSFEVYQPGNIPPGAYNVGVACTLGGASDTQMKDFWNVQMTFTTSPSDSPAQVTWTAANSAQTTTTTTIAGATTTTVTGATTTTIAGATTTTTLAGATTTTSTTAASGATTSTTRAAATTASQGSSGSGTVAGATLSRTGDSPTSWLAWAFVLLVFGRMAYVMSRPTHRRQGA